MPKLYSIRPTLTLKGRKFRGIRGWAGKPTHPPLTDFPIVCYVLAAGFDLVSYVAAQSDHGRAAHDFFVAGTLVIVSGFLVSLLTALTGFWDWWKSTSPGNQARRTANWHMTVMLTVTGIVILDIIIRLVQWGDNEATSTIVMILSIIIGALTAFGATYGGSLTYDYGFNVETSGDHPVWHDSEVDVLPGQK